MDGCAGKRSVDRLAVPRKVNGLVLRENMNKKDGKNVPLCSRIGCSAKVTSTKGTRVSPTDKNTKVHQSPVLSSSNGKEILGSSSRTPGGFGYLRKQNKVTAKIQSSSNLDKDSTDPAASDSTLTLQKTKRSTTNVHSQSAVSARVVMTEAGSLRRGTSRSIHQKSDLATQDALTGLSVSLSSSNNERTLRGGLSSNRLRNLRCNSVSDVHLTNSSSGTKVGATTKKISHGERSSSSKSNNGSVSEPKGRNQISSHDNTVSDNRSNRILPTIRDRSVVSSRGKRSGCFNRSERLAAVASSATSLQTLHPATPTVPNPSVSSSQSNTCSTSNSTTGRLSWIMHSILSEADPSRSLVNQDGLSHYNMNEIAEVLLALETIGHGEELTYEQLASLETNLFSSNIFRFSDQYRDMRLDIDNMSYEELLALGDKMGTVSTALSEEALSRSLKQSIYPETNDPCAISLNKDDDIKCSICQEDYVDGDEVGTMQCQHIYHMSCIQQWLRMKNWCPICKTSAEEKKHI